MESKNIIKMIESDVADFKALTDKWVASNDVEAANKSRAYAKKLMKEFKAYVTASIKDAATAQPIPVPEPEPVIEPEPVVVEEVVEDVVEEEEVELEEVQSYPWLRKD